MRPQSTPTPHVLRRVGVGLDTARYGHYAAFLRDDLQPAAAELPFAESAAGYALFRQRLEHLVQRHGPVHFAVRLDAAGQYADNLLHFLHRLGTPTADMPAAFHLTVSCGDPQRNKNYRAALFGPHKSDPVEARAAARFALTEQPAPSPALSLEQRTLRQVAGRLQAVVRQRTRLRNQFHHLLALTFPEVALLTKEVATGWVLELVHRYPTAALLATATPQDLSDIPYMPAAQVEPLLAQARSSIASLGGAAAVADLVREQVRQLRDAGARQKRLENLLVSAFGALPCTNHLATIPGIGDVTAAVLTAFIVDIHRFARPHQLVAYFGVLPIEVSSGVDREGQPRGPRRYVMSRRGNDLVRRYLWMAALSAIRHNPAARALYARVVAKHPKRKAVAVSHVMRKLLHLAWAVWTTDRPFDPAKYPWHAPAHVAGSAPPVPPPEQIPPPPEQAAGLKPDVPARTEVTAACTDTVADEEPVGEGTYVDFAHLKKQLPLARVLDQLGLLPKLRGSGPQRRGPCPLHRGDGRGRTFSVNLDEQVFHCFAATCGRKGDVIDLWAARHGLSLRAAALDLVRTFGLEPAPRCGTEKRHG